MREDIHPKLRLGYMDLAKGIGIILIILGHCPLNETFNNWIYSFHVPLFFIISGYFYNPEAPNFFKKSWSQLLKPVLLTTLICFLTLLVIFCKSGSYQGPDLINWIRDVVIFKDVPLGMWFIVALFWGKLILKILSGHLQSQQQFFIAILLFYLSWYGTKIIDIHKIPFIMAQGLLVPIVLLVGIYCKKIKLFERPLSNVELLSIVVILFSATNSPIGFFYAIFPKGIFSLIISALLSICFILVCARIDVIESKCIKIIKSILVFYGRNSLLVLCIHSWIHTVQINRIAENVLPLYSIGIIETVIIGVSIYAINFMRQSLTSAYEKS